MPCFPWLEPSIRPYWYVLTMLRPSRRPAGSQSFGFASASFGPRGKIDGFALDAYRENEWIAKIS